MRPSASAAPLLLIVLRFAQGIAIGGQWGGAVLIATENAPPAATRVLRQLCSSRRAGRRDPGEPRVSVDECEHGAGRIHAMGLARAVYRERGAHRPRAVRAVASRRHGRVPEAAEDTCITTLARARSAAHASEADRARSRGIPRRAGPVLYPDRVRDCVRHGSGGAGCVAQHHAGRSARRSGRDDSLARARCRMARIATDGAASTWPAPRCSPPGASRSSR